MPQECFGETSQVLIWVIVWAYKFRKQSFNQDCALVGGEGGQELKKKKKKKAKSHNIGWAVSWPSLLPPGQEPRQVHMPGAAGATEKEHRAPVPERPKWTLSGEHTVRRRQGWACVAVTRYRGKVLGGWSKGAGLHEGGKGAGPQRKDPLCRRGGPHRRPPLTFPCLSSGEPALPWEPALSHLLPHPSTEHQAALPATLQSSWE